MTRLYRRRALLQWLGATSLSLPWLAHESVAAPPDVRAGGLESFLSEFLRHLFPHRQLDSGVYGQVAVVLTGAIEADAGLLGLVTAGIDSMAGGSGQPWVDRPEVERLAAVRGVSDRPFFLALRGLGGLVFYSTPAVWRLIGYEGPSYEKGGYLVRGFDDIDWLQDADGAD